MISSKLNMFTGGFKNRGTQMGCGNTTNIFAVITLNVVTL